MPILVVNTGLYTAGNFLDAIEAFLFGSSKKLVMIFLELTGIYFIINICLHSMKNVQQYGINE
jgi:hypothetical protein